MIQPARESRRHRGLKVLVLLCTVMAIALPAMAAKSGGGGKGHGGSTGGTTSSNGSVKLKMVTDPNNDLSPNYGEQITFTVLTTATTRPFVGVNCYQGGDRVFGFSAGIFPDYPWSQIATLGSSLWTGGSANCTATGYYTTSNGHEVVFDTLGFSVAA